MVAGAVARKRNNNLVTFRRFRQAGFERLSHFGHGRALIDEQQRLDSGKGVCKKGIQSDGVPARSAQIADLIAGVAIYPDEECLGCHM